MPSTRSARLVAAAISTIGIDDVFDASTTSGRVTSSSRREHPLLLLGELDDRLDHQVGVGQRVQLGRGRDGRPSAASRSRRRACPRSLGAAPASARSARGRRATRSSSASTNVTSKPARAQTSTMPEPIRPHPTTPIFRTSPAYIAIPPSACVPRRVPAGKTIRAVIAAIVQRLIDFLPRSTTRWATWSWAWACSSSVDLHRPDRARRRHPGAGRRVREPGEAERGGGRPRSGRSPRSAASRPATGSAGRKGIALIRHIPFGEPVREPAGGRRNVLRAARRLDRRHRAGTPPPPAPSSRSWPAWQDAVRRFLLFDIPAIIVWAVAITWFGYAFGEHLDFVDKVLSRFGYTVLGLLVAFFLARWLWKRWRKAKSELPGPVER